METFKEFTISSKPFLPEVLQGILWQLDISGIQEEDNYLKVFCEKAESVNQTVNSKKLQLLVNEKVIESFKKSCLRTAEMAKTRYSNI